MKEQLFLCMEDWENPDVGGYDRQEQMMEAVEAFNQLHRTSFEPYKSYKEYEIWQRRRNSIFSQDR